MTTTEAIYEAALRHFRYFEPSNEELSLLLDSILEAFVVVKTERKWAPANDA